MGEKEKLRSEMQDKIMSGGAWFKTGQDRYVKIGYSKEDNCYFARECFRRGASLRGGAYSFGTDWFDISIHGKYIDIYADAETFRDWDIKSVTGAEEGPEDDGKADMAERLLNFCRGADEEVMEGDPHAFIISGTNFEKILEIRKGIS